MQVSELGTKQNEDKKTSRRSLQTGTTKAKQN